VTRPGKGVDDLRTQGVRREPQRGTNALLSQPGVSLHDLIDRLAGRELLQNQLNVIRVPATTGFPIRIAGSATIFCSSMEASEQSATGSIRPQHRASNPRD
jgi:hypothetical protein